MNIYKINTTSNEEEDFFLMTNLTEQEIVLVITPIVNLERNGGDTYVNYELLQALNKRYPEDTISMYNYFETITI